MVDIMNSIFYVQFFLHNKLFAYIPELQIDFNI